MQNANFLEVEDVYDANKVDLKVFRFERFSERRNVYIFVKRKEEVLP